MIFTNLCENGDIVFNEGFKFKSKEEAERALKKVSNNEKALEEYIYTFFKYVAAISTTPAIIINGIIVIPVGMICIQAITTWLAFPGTAGDKLNKCKKIIKKCDRTIDQLSKKNNADSKKLIGEYEKIRKHAVAEKEKYEKRVKELGKYNSNFKEATIFDDVTFI